MTEYAGTINERLMLDRIAALEYDKPNVRVIKIGKLAIPVNSLDEFVTHCLAHRTSGLWSMLDEPEPQKCKFCEYSGVRHCPSCGR